jgi:hypothetical protein
MPDDDHERGFLQADFEHVAASLLQNEELGEKRVTFFVTLVGAFLGGVGYLATDLREAMPFNPYAALALATFVLLLFGGLTWRRMIRRDKTTDKFKEILKVQREAGAPNLTAKYRGKLYDVTRVHGDRRFLDGGHRAVMLVLNSMLTLLLAWSAFRVIKPPPTPISSEPPTCCQCEEASP